MGTPPEPPTPTRAPALAPARATIQVEQNALTLLHDGDEVFPAMLAAIADAQDEILLEMYWFGSDEVGRHFAAALAAKARAGLRVAVLYDAVGSLETDGSFFRWLVSAGVDVREFNPVAPWRRRFDLAAINRRDHRKLLVLDGRVGFTGGVNLGDPWAPKSQGGGGWRDDMVRVEGPAAQTMRAIFAHGWETAGGFFRPMTKLDGASPTELPPEGERVRLLANHDFGDARAIRSAYLERIKRARRSVYITNSYFLPDRVVRRALMRAARRGVDVRVLIPGKIDVPAVAHAAQRMLPRLLRAGVRVFRWGGEILHAKTACVDGAWATVGTFNLDHRSWRYNLEVNLAVWDEDFAAGLETKFLEDLEASNEVKSQDLEGRSIKARLLEMFFWRFRRLL